MLNHEMILRVLRYATAVAGNSDDGQRRELGPIHLIKYLYLADLAHAEQHGGQTLTGIPWRFHHFGPWAVEAFEQIEPAMAIPEIERRSFEGRYQDDVVRYRATDRGLEERLEDQLPRIVARAVKNAVHDYDNDTSALLHHVYCTPPMLAAAPGDALDLSRTEPIESASVQEASAPPAKLSRSALKRRKEAHDRLKARFQAALKRRIARVAAVAEPQPRYDEVFVRGQEWLDDRPREPAESLEGELVVSEEVWKSLARTGPSIP